MPLYEYMCQKCGRPHEIMQKISERPLKSCPACGGRMEKKISRTAFQLKGSGWYKDGYATPAKKSEGTTDSVAAKTDSPSKDAQKKPEVKKSKADEKP